MKLALHKDQSVIIETRGEGGYFCTNTTTYKVIQGVLDLENLNAEIPIITPKEREFLLETARSLTRYFPKSSNSKNSKPFSYKEPAINDFNDKYPIMDLFVRHGWEIIDDRADKIPLLRPGSSAQHSGYYFKDTNTFFCFSTSAGFKTDKPYNHFQILQVLEGENNYNNTIRLLPDLGFEINNKQSKISTEDIVDYINSHAVRYDTFIQDHTKDGNIIDELDLNTLFIDLKKNFNKEIPRSRFDEIFKSHYINKINAIDDFINKNMHRNPSGTFNKWLDCMELENPLVKRDTVLHFLKKWYVGMVAQSMGGEYPNEFFLTLLSTEQGVGKSTLLRNYTLPKELHKYRVEHSLTFDDDFKILMGQVMLIIDDEMDGRSYETQNTFKNILSNKEWRTRKSYDRRHSHIIRRCSFAGSGNNLQVVRESGNRRIIPIEIKKIHYKKLAKIDLDDLFMEAYNLFKGGFHYSYEKSDQKLLIQLYGDYIQKSDVELILDQYIKEPENKEDEEFIPILQLTQRLINLYPYFEKRINVVAIGKLMNSRGLRKVRKGPQNISGYIISKQSHIISSGMDLNEDDPGIVLLG